MSFQTAAVLIGAAVAAPIPRLDPSPRRRHVRPALLPPLESEPAFKASILKMVLEHVDELPAAAAVRRHLDPQVQREIAEASRTQWLPGAWGVQIYEALAAALGETAVLTVAAAMVSVAPTTPMFQPLLRGVIHIFGREPVELLRAYPHAQRFIARNCGTCEVVFGRPTTVRFQRVPEALRRRVWLVGQFAVIEAMLVLAGGAGRVEIDAPRFATTGTVDFLVHT
ncbi:hypothetical protein [Nannocystis radixulma]|uniref:TIGR02265 family protein n=1 Tax=Nannocystis radixulma TaxID=2995305 RepID=A0ABT5AXM7_9BACT|nr:hypothetical protein [Nannocystis radixulma]MDC0666600.1 hypothetical protein [Nannocystis radixulma]